MNHKLTESIIENFAIELFQRLGYEYVYAPDIAPDSENPVRSSFEEVILTERLTKRFDASMCRCLPMQWTRRLNRASHCFP